MIAEAVLSLPSNILSLYNIFVLSESRCVSVIDYIGVYGYFAEMGRKLNEMGNWTTVGEREVPPPSSIKQEEWT